jgi:hypothetical protein
MGSNDYYPLKGKYNMIDKERIARLQSKSMKKQAYGCSAFHSVCLT